MTPTIGYNPMFDELHRRGAAGGPSWSSGELNPLVDAPGLPAAVAELIPRHTALHAQWVAARVEADRAADAVKGAEAADAAARAQALAHRRPEPKPTAPAAIKAAAEAARRRDDLGRATAIIEADIRDAVAAHATQWIAALDAEAARLAQVVREAIDAVDAALLDRARIAQLRRIATDPHGSKVWRGGGYAIVPDQWRQAVAALRAAVGAPQAPFYADGTEHQLTLGH